MAEELTPLQKNRISLYNALNAEGYDVPSFQDFDKKLDDPLAASNLYNQLLNDGLDVVPDINDMTISKAELDEKKFNKFRERVSPNYQESLAERARYATVTGAREFIETPGVREMKHGLETMSHAGAVITGQAEGEEPIPSISQLAGGAMEMATGAIETQYGALGAFSPLIQGAVRMVQQVVKGTTGLDLPDPTQYIANVGKAFKVDFETAAKIIRMNPNDIKRAGALGETLGDLGAWIGVGGVAIEGLKSAVSTELPVEGTETKPGTYQYPRGAMAGEPTGPPKDPEMAAHAKSEVARLKKEILKEHIDAKVEGRDVDATKVARIGEAIQSLRTVYPEELAVPKKGVKDAIVSSGIPPLDLETGEPAVPSGLQAMIDKAKAREAAGEKAIGSTAARIAGEKIKGDYNAIAARWEEYKRGVDELSKTRKSQSDFASKEEFDKYFVERSKADFNNQLIQEEVAAALGNEGLVNLTHGEIEARLNEGRVAMEGGTPTPRMTDDEVIESLQGITDKNGNRKFTDYEIAAMKGSVRRYFATGGREGGVPEDLGSLSMNKGLIDAAKYGAWALEKLGNNLDNLTEYLSGLYPELLKDDVVKERLRDLVLFYHTEKPEPNETLDEYSKRLTDLENQAVRSTKSLQDIDQYYNAKSQLDKAVESGDQNDIDEAQKRLDAVKAGTETVVGSQTRYKDIENAQGVNPPDDMDKPPEDFRAANFLVGDELKRWNELNSKPYSERTDAEKFEHADLLTKAMRRASGAAGGEMGGTLSVRVFPDFAKAYQTAKPVVGDIAESLGKFFKAATYWIDPRFFTAHKLGEGIPAEIVKRFNYRHVAEDRFANEYLNSVDKNANWFKNYLDKTFSPKDLDNLMLSRGKPESSAGKILQKQAKAQLPLELKSPKINAAIQQMADFNFKELKKLFGDDVNRAADYFYGIYKNPENVDSFLKYWQTTTRWTKEKQFPTYADAKAFGLEIRNPNPIDNLMAEYKSIAFTHSMNQLAEYAKGMGLAKENSLFAPDNWVGIKNNAFRGYRYDPDFARMANSLLTAVPRSDLITPLRAIVNGARFIKLGISTFHQMSISKQAYNDSKFSGFATGKPLESIYQAAKGFNPRDVFGNEFHERYLNNGGGHRMSFEGEANTMAQQIAKSIDKVGLIPSIVKLPIDQLANYTNWLFETFIPRVKEGKVYQNWQQFLEKNGREPSDAELQSIIRETQNFYGEMNESMFGRSGIATSMLRMIFLAPGYGEGNYRALIRGMQQAGRAVAYNPAVKGLQSLGYLEGAKLKPAEGRSVRSIGQTLLFSGLTATVGTMIMTGKLPQIPQRVEDLGDLFKIKTGTKDDKGKEVYVDMRSYDRDYTNVLLNLLSPGKAGTAVLQRIRGMEAPTLQFTGDLVKLVNGENLIDWRGNRIVDVTDSKLQAILKTGLYEMNRYAPITISQSLLNIRERKIGYITSAVETLAGVRPTYSEQDFRDRDAVHQLYEIQGDREKIKNIILNSTDNPRKVLNDYNSAVDAILKSDLVSQKVKDYWKKLHIDVTKFMMGLQMEVVSPKSTTAQAKRAQDILSKFQKAPTVGDHVSE